MSVNLIPYYNMPDKYPLNVTGQKLRSMSTTLKRSPNCAVIQKLKQYDDQDFCHKVQNSIQTKAYNMATNHDIRVGIAAFNYSTDNIINSACNDNHSKMEKDMAGEKQTPSHPSYRQKTEMMTTAQRKLKEQYYCYDEVMATILQAMMETGKSNPTNKATNYQEFVASQDKSVFCTDAVKALINQAQLKSEWYN